MAFGSLIEAWCRSFTGGRGAAQISGGVTLGAAGGDGVAEDLAAVLHRPVRGFQRAAALDAAKRGQQFRRGYRGDGPRAEPGEDVALETAQDLAGMAVHPVLRELGVPLCCRCSLGSMPLASSRRASSRFKRACLSETSG